MRWNEMEWRENHRNCGRGEARRARKVQKVCGEARHRQWRGKENQKPVGQTTKENKNELRKGSFAELVCEELSQLIKASFYEEKLEKHSKCE